MVANSIQKRIAIALESGSLDSPGAINYDSITSPGGLWAVTSVDDAALRRAYIENKTVPRRASEQPSMLRGLRSEAAATISAYLCGQTSSHAAAGSQAARDLTDLVLRAAWGGEYRGYSAAITGGTAANPEVTAGHGDNVDPYTWGYFWDESAQVGHFRLIASATTDELTMAEGHNLPFTPANGDRMYGVIAHYVDWDVAEDYTDTAHELLRMLLSGRQADDLYELYGAKPEIQIGSIEQGAPTEMTIPVKCAYFLNSELAITPALAQQLQGAPGPIVGAGTTTRCWYADAGAALAAQQFWGGIQFTAGVVPEQVRGPNGREGVHGYGLTADSYKAQRLELMVPYDTDHRDDAEAGQAKHCLIQVGNLVTTGPWGIYMPRLTWSDDTEAGSESNSRRQMALRFQCEEAPDDGSDGAVDLTGLSTAEVHRAKAKFVLLRVA